MHVHEFLEERDQTGIIPIALSFYGLSLEFALSILNVNDPGNIYSYLLNGLSGYKNWTTLIYVWNFKFRQFKIADRVYVRKWTQDYDFSALCFWLIVWWN